MTTIFSNNQTVVEQSDPFEAAVLELEAQMAGWVLLPGDEDYEEARLTQNRAYSRFPAVIVQAVNAEDVALAVRFARSRGLTLSVRSGGHSFTAQSSNDGGMVIDLRLLNKVSIDPETGLARAQPAVKSSELGAAAQEHGMALSTGDTPTVALGGLTLGGGIGYMVRKQGLTIDNLRSVEMVTAYGQIVRASQEENPDLFWALRGGGGNFGIVTEFEYQLQPVGTVYAGLIALPLTSDALRGVAEYGRRAPNDLTMIINIMAAPPAPFVPEDLVGKPVVIAIVCYAGDPTEGEKAMQPIRDIATPVFEFVAPMPYPAIYAFTEELAQPLSFFSRTLFTKDLSDNVVDTFVDAMQLPVSPGSVLQVRPLGGKFADVPADATAFAHRDAGYMLAAIGVWENGTPGDSEVAWAQAVYEMIAAESCGAYVNFLQDEPERIGEAYPEATYRRLAEVKRRYDPENVFSQNVNIKAE
ncbi:MAG TPA: FAD-binding oxidoreductase [Dehalococcoidia bacterium]|nr:FAD-binding oxidoreductase [Dehalococcoidia bacterium]